MSDTVAVTAALLERLVAALERMAPPAVPPVDFEAAEAFVWQANPVAFVPVPHVNRQPLKLLKGNGIEGEPTVFSDLGGEEAADALVAGSIDAVFLSGDLVTPKVLRRLRQTPGVELMNFKQANGYVRRFRFLSRQTLPEGSLDLGANFPPRNYQLVGPTVELVARVRELRDEDRPRPHPRARRARERAGLPGPHRSPRHRVRAVGGRAGGGAASRSGVAGYGFTSTPFQNAYQPRISSAAGFGSG